MPSDWQVNPKHLQRCVRGEHLQKKTRLDLNTTNPCTCPTSHFQLQALVFQRDVFHVCSVDCGLHWNCPEVEMDSGGRGRHPFGDSGVAPFPHDLCPPLEFLGSSHDTSLGFAKFKR